MLTNTAILHHGNTHRVIKSMSATSTTATVGRRVHLSETCLYYVVKVDLRLSWATIVWFTKVIYGCSLYEYDPMSQCKTCCHNVSRQIEKDSFRVLIHQPKWKSTEVMQNITQSFYYCYTVNVCLFFSWSSYWTTVIRVIIQQENVSNFKHSQNFMEVEFDQQPVNMSNQ